MGNISRRDMLKVTGAAAVTTILGGIPLNAFADNNSTNREIRRRYKVMVVGAHPDDPETGCGGTMCLLTRAGHEVVTVYLTRGEAGIAGKSHEEAAAIRVVESENACKVTGTRHIFMNQIDGNTEINLERYKEMRELFEREKPDVVITHWPIDSHRDHAICGLLVLDAWRRVGRTFRLYYFEAMSGTQSQMFTPTDYVNITPVLEQKHRACDCHVSQGMPEIYKWHGVMEQFRGLECRCEAAEAFARHIEPLDNIV